MKQYIFLPNKNKNGKRTHSIIVYEDTEDKAWDELENILQPISCVDACDELTLDEIKEMYFLSAVI